MFTLSYAVVLYVANVLLGLGLQLRLVHLRWRIWHHLLYAALMLCTLLALYQHWQQHQPWGMLLYSIVILAMMPLTKPRRWQHFTLAALAMPGYLGALWNLNTPF